MILHDQDYPQSHNNPAKLTRIFHNQDYPHSHYNVDKNQPSRPLEASHCVAVEGMADRKVSDQKKDCSGDAADSQKVWNWLLTDAEKPNSLKIEGKLKLRKSPIFSFELSID